MNKSIWAIWDKYERIVIDKEGDGLEVIYLDSFPSVVKELLDKVDDLIIAEEDVFTQDEEGEMAMTPLEAYNAGLEKASSIIRSLIEQGGVGNYARPNK